MKKIAVLLPPPPFNSEDINNLKTSIAKELESTDVVFLHRNNADDAKYYESISNIAFWVECDGNLKCAKTKNLIDANIVVAAKNRANSIAMAEDKIDWLLKKMDCFYYDSLRDYFYSYKNNNVVEDEQNLKSHFFSNIASNTQKQSAECIYYPYGHFIRQPDYKDVNEFGFRILQDYAHLANREQDHKLITIFGGSVAWSSHATTKQRFSALLEEKLLQNGQKVTVLNFGMPAYVILNEIVTYTIFAWQLKPDVVISLSGYNDMHAGAFTDELLKTKFDMNYPAAYQTWAAELRGKEHKEQHIWRMSHGVSAGGIVDSFINRNKQFREMAMQNGAKFIFALQPIWNSKKSHTKQEKEFFKSLYNAEPDQPMLTALRFLYNRLKKSELQIDIDFDEIFSKLDENSDVFYDICHLNNYGEQILAENFANLLQKSYL